MRALGGLRMKSPAFDYLRAHDLRQAMEAHAGAHGDAVYLAGGHSVMPSLALRLQAPSLLIDISHIPDLSGVRLEGGWLRIGAMTRHAAALTDPLIAAHAPLLRAAAPHVAHPAIRTRGTIGGSISLADPAAEFPAVALAMRAEMEVLGEDGPRRIPADDFFLDIYETAMAPGEILVAIHVPPLSPGWVIGFDELARRRGDYAMVGVAVQGAIEDGALTAPSIAFLSVGPCPTRARGAEAALAGRPIDAETIAAAQAALADDLAPPDDPAIPASVRLHLARVLLGRVLSTLEGAA